MTCHWFREYDDIVSCMATLDGFICMKFINPCLSRITTRFVRFLFISVLTNLNLHGFSLILSSMGMGKSLWMMPMSLWESRLMRLSSFGSLNNFFNVFSLSQMRRSLLSLWAFESLVVVCSLGWVWSLGRLPEKVVVDPLDRHGMLC